LKKTIATVILIQGMEDYGQFYEILWEMNSINGQKPNYRQRKLISEVVLELLENGYIELVKVEQPLSLSDIKKIDYKNLEISGNSKIWEVPERYEDSKLRFITTENGEKHLIKIRGN